MQSLSKTLNGLKKLDCAKGKSGLIVVRRFIKSGQLPARRFPDGLERVAIEMAELRKFARERFPQYTPGEEFRLPKGRGRSRTSKP